MTTYFISDLHLHASRPLITERFCKFLLQEAQNAEALYILGDFFEVWVGDDIQDPHDIYVMEALIDYINKGIPVYFMHGNRDFLLGKRFADKTGCQLISDPYPIELHGKRYVLAHGDTLCTLDVKYQRFRRFVRHPIIKGIFLSLSLAWRKKIAGHIRIKSSEERDRPKTHTIHPSYYDVTHTAVFRMLRKHKAYTLIHGHTHKPGIHDFILDNQSAQRIVLGDWESTRAYILKLTAKEYKLINLMA